MWNIIKFLDIYYNENPSQNFVAGEQNNETTLTPGIFLLIILLIGIIIFLIFYIIDLKRDKNKENGDK